MRVIAGAAKGRRLHAAGDTRPTADAVKEALFSTLGPQVIGARVLDLYAGSGALGIEALSRGADSATFVEREPSAAAAVRRNLSATAFEGRARVVQGPVERFLASPDAGSFDLVLADPPYAEEGGGLLEALVRSSLLDPGALVVLEVAAGTAVEAPPGLRVRGSRRYGDSALVYLEAAGLGDARDPGAPGAGAVT